jgi:hypothetical protein
MVERYVHDWIVSVMDFTPVAKAIHDAVQSRTPLPEAPVESEYPISDEIRHRLAISPA